jgi:multidrug efflux pump subunit AcrA (membrane-fusion protein)
MADFATLEMEVDVFERDIALVKDEGPATILVTALGETRFPGRVRQVVPTADRSKGTVQVKVSFLETDPRIVPEMAGKVVFFREKPAADLAREVVAPRRAVLTKDGQTGVWILERDRVRFRGIKTGEERGENVVIREGLRGGESLVLDPDPVLSEGTVVRKKES